MKTPIELCKENHPRLVYKPCVVCERDAYKEALKAIDKLADITHIGAITYKMLNNGK